jgi:glycerol-3-phosphate dehydrogenase (NAD(P)+)
MYAIEKVGVLGSGSFGICLANLLSENYEVMLYARRQEVLHAITVSREYAGQRLSDKVYVTNDLKLIADSCKLIFPVVSSSGFRDVMQKISPYLTPGHVLIHGTKGLDVTLLNDEIPDDDFSESRKYIFTMSDVILQETSVKRIGVISGPNLAAEIAQGLPAATVVASKYDDVIELAIQALKSPRFKIYTSKDLVGTELAGVLKNPIAIASGIHAAMDLGHNARAFLITRGFSEMIKIGKVLKSDMTGFLGLAGIGDLIATCSGNLSRNFSVGYRIGKGEKLKDILNSLQETAEGINTVKIAYSVSKHYKLRTPLFDALYAVLFQEASPNDALKELLNSPTVKDVDFI